MSPHSDDEKQDAHEEAREEREERREELLESAKEHADHLHRDLKELEDVSVADDNMVEREKFERLSDQTEEIRKELD